MTTEEADASRTPARSRWLWVWVLGCVLALVAAFGLGTLVRSPWDQAIANSESDPLVTATVEERTIGAGTADAPGVVAAGVVTSVTVSGETPSVVTAVGTPAGQTLAAGQVLAEVSGRPLVALTLPFPLYRDLTPGVTGPDVTAVQTALAELGLFHGAADGEYGPVTSAAVEQLYRRVGATAPAAPEEATAALEAATVALESAERALDDADLAVTAATAARSAAVQAGEPTAELDLALAQAQSARSAAAAERGRAATKSAEARADLQTPLPFREVVRVPAGGALVESVAPVGTALAGDAADVAKLRSGAAQVTVRIGVDEAPSYGVGATATVTAVTDTALTASAVVAAVGEFQALATDDGRPPGYDVTLALGADQPFADGADVVVTPATALPGTTGLAVPVVALREDTRGRYLLLAAPAADDAPARRLDVTVTTTTDGYAIVEGEGIEVGTVVVVSGRP